METPVDQLGSHNWEEIVPHREGVRLEDIDAFENFMVITERREGVPMLRIRDHKQGDEFEIPMSEPVLRQVQVRTPSTRLGSSDTTTRLW